ncbi:MAG TPA: type II secretion system protein [Urbifossiella sp.]|jgi:prepilin-type N-terminal cleavage/methylation domain-containing protein|nr:type II secretion system protein [Urbifossiella sp.]
MTAVRHTPGRPGFTLIELLVAMAIIVTLAAIAVAVVPGALDQDRTTDAAATIRQHLMIAKARATRENNGRGIRFIVPYDPNNTTLPDPTNLLRTDARWSTEMQYIEAAPTIVPNPLGLTGATDAFVEFDFSTPASPVCRMFNVPATGAGSDAVQMINNDLAANWFPNLYCPVLGPDAFGRTQRFDIIGIAALPTPANSWVLSLSNFPVTLIGAGTKQRVYRFAVEPRSRPLLGEPNIPLPRNVCVDLVASSPAVQPITLPNGQVVFTDFEIMFAPNGQVIDPVSSGQIFLWVRDFTKFNGNPAANIAGVFNLAAFQQGGEQQLVSIKAKTGALGVFPVLWPQPDGTYLAGPPAQSPYFFAQNAASSP